MQMNYLPAGAADGAGPIEPGPFKPIERQAHDTHAQFFLPINFSTNSAPQMILKILLVVSITMLISYTILQNC